MSSNKNIDQNGLDELLREFALEKNSDSVDEAEADFVLGLDYDVKIDEKKEKEIISKLRSGRGGNTNLWFIVSGVLFFGLIFLLWLYLNNEKHMASGFEDETGSVVSYQKQEGKMELNDAGIPAIKIKDTFGRSRTVKRMSPDTLQRSSAEEEPKEKVEREMPFYVPYISEKDIVRYGKIKEQMILRLLKKDKALYTHVPSSKTSYAGKEIIVDGFTIRNVSITNLEYRAFLADLLAQKKNDEYIKANVNDENWLKNGYEGLVNYFEDERYNDYPVVNVTYDGAVLFCKWLQEEASLFAGQNKHKEVNLLIRMPYDEEWIYSARDGYAKIPFEQGYNTIYDESEGLVDKAFTKRVELVKRRTKRIDTLYSQFIINHYGWGEKEISELLENGNKYYSSRRDTIYPERMKVLGKIGRVSEMTGQRNGSKIYLTGLSWKSKSDYQKLENEFKKDLSSPFVGFRIVLIDPNEPEYKNPFW